MKVEVVRSPRRRKTVQARLVGGVMRLSIPAGMSRAEEERWTAVMTRRMERRRSAEHIDLARRARDLAARLDLRTPASIRWVDNQESRWGSCTPSERTIRISSKLAQEPAWVLDYVIVHELAHLTVPGHGSRFWALVGRYPLAERARGFLMARSMEPPWPENDDETEPSAPDETWREAVACEQETLPFGTQVRPVTTGREEQSEKLSQDSREGEGGGSSLTNSLLRSRPGDWTSRRLLPPGNSFATASEP
ncbi:MAG: M48 family metallopeptidase [Acidimicrobiales bacterium]|nr:M48 family metallopeptidase [Acidimicrobiales bacterium]